MAYIEGEFGEKVVNEIGEKIAKKLYQVSNFPYSSPAYGENGLRRCIINRRASFFYSVDSSRTVTVLAFESNSQSSLI